MPSSSQSAQTRSRPRRPWRWRRHQRWGRGGRSGGGARRTGCSLCFFSVGCPGGGARGVRFVVSDFWWSGPRGCRVRVEQSLELLWWLDIGVAVSSASTRSSCPSAACMPAYISSDCRRTGVVELIVSARPIGYLWLVSAYREPDRVVVAKPYVFNDPCSLMNGAVSAWTYMKSLSRIAPTYPCAICCGLCLLYDGHTSLVSRRHPTSTLHSKRPHFHTPYAPKNLHTLSPHHNKTVLDTRPPGAPARAPLHITILVTPQPPHMMPFVRYWKLSYSLLRELLVLSAISPSTLETH